MVRRKGNGEGQLSSASPFLFIVKIQMKAVALKVCKFCKVHKIILL